MGLPIIDLSRGIRVAEVKDLICDHRQGRVVGLLLDKGGLLRAGKAIPWQLIYSIGQDAVTIQDSSGILPLKAVWPEHNHNKYVGKEVLTTSGQYLGLVDDLALDTTTGRIMGCVLTDGIVGDILSGRAIIPVVESARINDENIIVPDEPTDLAYDWRVESEPTTVSHVQQQSPGESRS